MAILKNTIKHHVKKLIIKKTLFLIALAVVMGFLAYFASTKPIVTGSEHWHLLYVIGSVVVTLAVLLLVAWRIRYFHNLFGKDWTGTVIKNKSVSIYKDSIRGIHSFTITVRLDHNNKKKRMTFSLHKLPADVFLIGDRIHMIKGTRYPINITREAAQHICPMCARNSCYGDFCPDCNLKY